MTKNEVDVHHIQRLTTQSPKSAINKYYSEITIYCIKFSVRKLDNIHRITCTQTTKNWSDTTANSGMAVESLFTKPYM